MRGDEGFELKSLRFATLVLVVLSIGVFIMQRFIVTIFDPVFEICIFHLSTLVSLTSYLWRRRNLKNLGKGEPRGDARTGFKNQSDI